MKERFENDGHPQLVYALRRQELVAGNDKLTEALIKHGELVEYLKGDKLIVEGGEDNEIFPVVRIGCGRCQGKRDKCAQGGTARRRNGSG